MVYSSVSDQHGNTFVEQQAKDTFYYNPLWLDLITSLYGYKATSFKTADDEGAITGFLPVCTVGSMLTGRRVVALPFSDRCPLIAADDASVHKLVDQAIEFASRQRASYLELRTGQHEVLAQRSDLVAVENLYVSWLLSLGSDADALWPGLHKPVQRQIKKSRKLGVQVRFAQQREEVEHYYQLHLLTRSHKHGMPAQPRRFFQELWHLFAAQDKMKLLLAEYEGKVIAGMILLASGSVVRYAYGASDERYLHLAPNNLLLWESIVWGCQHGYTMLDLGRTACDNEGLMEFKRRWGAVKEPLVYYYYPQQAGLASTSEQSLKYRLLTGVWKKLPLEITGPMGGYLYRHLG
jgi:FemAB-related protein (PEP-CTERM system-associated)